MRRRIIIAVVVALLIPTATTIASNWGAAKTGTAAKYFCTQGSYWSECTPEDRSVTFYLSQAYPLDGGLETAFRTSLSADFDALPNVSGTVITNFGAANVQVYQRTIDDSWPRSYTTCAASSAQGFDEGYVNYRYYRWCTPQVMIFQEYPAAYTDCWNHSGCVSHYMCHEIGHTYGLQHTGRNTSCMEDDVNQNVGVLDAEDKDNLADCWPRPATNTLDVFPDTQKTALCNDYPD